MEEDWRVDSAKFLRGQPLRHKTWVRWSEEREHDHCAACGAKFAEFDGRDIHKAGHATTESYNHGADYNWVCGTCFAELKDKLGWYEAV